MAYDQLMQSYLGVGLLADRPAAPNVKVGVGAFYYATDTPALYVWDGATWHTLAGGATTLAADTDVAIASPTDGQVLTYVTADGKWENRAAAGGGASVVKQIQHAAQTADNVGISSGSLADYPNLSRAITVSGTGSNSVVVHLAGTVEMSGTGLVRFAVTLAGTTVSLGQYWCSGGNQLYVGGLAFFDNVPAGAQTVQPKYLTLSATLYCRPISGNPGNECMNMLVTEYAN